MSSQFRRALLFQADRTAYLMDQAEIDRRVGDYEALRDKFWAIQEQLNLVELSWNSEGES